MTTLSQIQLWGGKLSAKYIKDFLSNSYEQAKDAHTKANVSGNISKYISNA